MISFYKNNKHLIIGILFVSSILPFFIPLSDNKNIEIPKEELYNQNLIYVNSLDKATSYIDSLYSLEYNVEFDTSKYVQTVSKFTKERFYYGLSHYSFSNNWIAALGGKLLWTHLSAIVDPEDILKHKDGLCSQQTIVFMELLKKKKIHVRTVGLGYKEGPGHFLAEVSYGGKWHMYDINLEPKWEKIVHHHESVDYYRQFKDSLFLTYEGIISRQLFDKIMEKVQYGEVNEFPAKNMLLFHKVTNIFTYLLPLFFLTAFVFSVFNKSKKEQVLSSSEKVETDLELRYKNVSKIVEQTV